MILDCDDGNDDARLVSRAYTRRDSCKCVFVCMCVIAVITAVIGRCEEVEMVVIVYIIYESVSRSYELRWQFI